MAQPQFITRLIPATYPLATRSSLKMQHCDCCGTLIVAPERFTYQGRRLYCLPCALAVLVEKAPSEVAA
jgi:hypothetical protein